MVSVAIWYGIQHIEETQPTAYPFPKLHAESTLFYKKHRLGNTPITLKIGKHCITQSEK